MQLNTTATVERIEALPGHKQTIVSSNLTLDTALSLSLSLLRISLIILVYHSVVKPLDRRSVLWIKIKEDGMQGGRAVGQITQLTLILNQLDAMIGPYKIPRV